MKIKSILFLLLYFLCISSIAEETSTLNGIPPKLSNFIIHANIHINAKIDSTTKINNDYPVHFFQPVVFGDVYTLHLSMERYTYLPKLNTDSIKINFTCRTENLIYNELMIRTIDSLEQVINTDTIHALTNNKWLTFTRTVSTRNTRFLNLHLYAQGKRESNQTQNLWIDKIEILANNIHIDTITDTPRTIPNIPDSSIIQLNKDKVDFDKITELQNHKIIAIGESMHGSESINNLAMDIIRHQVKKNNCKVILLEIPFEDSFYWNEYVQGNENVSLDSIEWKKYNTSTNELRKVLTDLKEYNKKSPNKKVFLLGLDISLTDEQATMRLIRYLSSLTNKNYAYEPVLHKLIDNIEGKMYMNDLDKLKNTLEYCINNKKQLEKLLGRINYKLLKKSLEFNINTPDDFYYRQAFRDYYMAENVEFLMKNILTNSNNKNNQSTMVIYAHNLHCFKAVSGNSFVMKSMGKYLNEKFNDDYAVISILAGKGNTNFLTATPQTQPLQTPPRDSIEGILLEKNIDLCYFPTSALSISPVQIRVLGYYYYNNQFLEKSIQSSANAVLFLKDSKAAMVQ